MKMLEQGLMVTFIHWPVVSELFTDGPQAGVSLTIYLDIFSRTSVALELAALLV